MFCDFFFFQLFLATIHATSYSLLDYKTQFLFILSTGTHSANFNEKVHKPQSKSYSRIGANMQLIFTHIISI